MSDNHSVDAGHPAGDQAVENSQELPPRSVIRRNPANLGLPPRVFLYTLDQVASMLSYSEAALKGKMVYFDGRSTGPQPTDKLLARNIAPAGTTPEWRIAEQEFMRWLKYKGFRLYEAAWARS
jgi:hypothetical protein